MSGFLLSPSSRAPILALSVRCEKSGVVSHTRYSQGAMSSGCLAEGSLAQLGRTATLLLSQPGPLRLIDCMLIKLARRWRQRQRGWACGQTTVCNWYGTILSTVWQGRARGKINRTALMLDQRTMSFRVHTAVNKRWLLCSRPALAGLSWGSSRHGFMGSTVGQLTLIICLDKRIKLNGHRTATSGRESS